MWVAENVSVQQVSMVADLRLRVKAAARVIQIDVVPGIESAIVGGPQRVHRVRAVVLGMGLQECGVCHGFRSAVSPRRRDAHALQYQALVTGPAPPSRTCLTSMIRRQLAESRSGPFLAPGGPPAGGGCSRPSVVQSKITRLDTGRLKPRPALIRYAVVTNSRPFHGPPPSPVALAIRPSRRSLALLHEAPRG